MTEGKPLEPVLWEVVFELAIPHEGVFPLSALDLAILHCEAVENLVEERCDRLAVRNARLQVPDGVVDEDEEDGLQLVWDLHSLLVVQKVGRSELPVSLPM